MRRRILVSDVSVSAVERLTGHFPPSEWTQNHPSPDTDYWSGTGGPDPLHTGGSFSSTDLHSFISASLSLLFTGERGTDQNETRRRPEDRKASKPVVVCEGTCPLYT